MIKIIGIRNKYKMSWIDRGSYYEHTAAQGTKPWGDARLGRVNSSNSGAMVGKSPFKTAEETGKIIAGVVEEQFSDKSIQAMDHGHFCEPRGRNWYEKTYDCKVIERGLCVSKEDFRFGASVDGEIVGKDGIIEIKCPKKMWNPILNYMNAKERGWKPPPNYYDHIYDTHLCQMMHGMAILKKSFCDYIVYSTEDNKVFVQRVHFDPEFWNNHYQILKKNYELYIAPYLINSKYPISPI